MVASARGLCKESRGLNVGAWSEPYWESWFTRECLWAWCWLDARCQVTYSAVRVVPSVRWSQPSLRVWWVDAVLQGPLQQSVNELEMYDWVVERYSVRIEQQPAMNGAWGIRTVAVQNSSVLLTSSIEFFLLRLQLTSSLSTTKIRMATVEDIFEGAIGIDLGTTYSWVALRCDPVIDSPMLIVVTAASVFGRMTALKSLPTTVIPFSYPSSLFFNDLTVYRG